jgi:hypothetical protein
MLVHHLNRNESYDIYDNGKTFFIKGDTLYHPQGKESLHQAVWDLIDWMRTMCFTNLTDSDCKAIQILSRTDKRLEKNEVMNSICGKKMNRMYYEDAYDLLVHTYSNKKDKFVLLNNESNFFIYEEIIQLLRFSILSVSETISHRLKS